MWVGGLESYGRILNVQICLGPTIPDASFMSSFRDNQYAKPNGTVNLVLNMEFTSTILPGTTAAICNTINKCHVCYRPMTRRSLHKGRKQFRMLIYFFLRFYSSAGVTDLMGTQLVLLTR